jgi:hypothetical protein
MTNRLHYLTLESDEIREIAACLVNTLERRTERATEPVTQAVLPPHLVSAFRKAVEAMYGIDPYCEDVEDWAHFLFGRIRDNNRVEDTRFIDDIGGRAKEVIVQLRKGRDGGNNDKSLVESASEFLAQRLGDAPANEQGLRLVLSTLLAVHLYLLTPCDGQHGPDERSGEQ